MLSVSLDGYGEKHDKNRGKEGIFDKSLSKYIDISFRLREKADYQDFMVITKEQAEEQYRKSEQLMFAVKPFLEEQWNKK